MNSNGIVMMVETGDDMRAIGERLSKLTHGGDVVLLSGPLGAGKTTFAQGFGAGLGITEPCLLYTSDAADEL